MQSSKKTLLSIVSFFLIVATLCVIGVESFFASEYCTYQDMYFRNSISGSLNCLIVGSCQGKYAFVPSILDKDLNICSYNLCGIHTSPSGEIAILEEEIDRNPVDIVIVDINYDTLSYTTKGIKALGDMTLIPRLQKWQTKSSYFIKNVHIEDYPILLSEYLRNGYAYLYQKITGHYKSAVNKDLKGCLSVPSNDFTIKLSEKDCLFQKESLNTVIIENNDSKVDTIIKMCKSRGITVYLVMTPVTDNYVWSFSGWDQIHTNIKRIADKNKVVFLDFNLYKSKKELFSDKTSFEGKWHLSDSGQVVFTKELCSVIKMIEKDFDISSLFYADYEEALNNSPYVD